MSIEVTITELFLFPVKALCGVAVASAEATVSGFAGDRQWAVFKPDGHPLTQRQNPRMVLIRPQLSAQGIKLSAPDMGEIEVDNPPQGSAKLNLRVWKDDCVGQIAGDDVNTWLTECLKSREALRLIKTHPEHKRRFDDPARFHIEGQYFSDAAPYLLANHASVDALNQSLLQEGHPPVNIRHFRPNIVISDVSAFDEHDYHYLGTETNSLNFKLIDRCQRCAVITVDPDTGKYLPKARPFKTLAKLNAMPNSPKAPAFGINCTLEQGCGQILTCGQKLFLS